jgi:hypothetical protein
MNSPVGGVPTQFASNRVFPLKAVGGRILGPDLFVPKTQSTLPQILGESAQCMFRQWSGWSPHLIPTVMGIGRRAACEMRGSGEQLLGPGLAEGGGYLVSSYVNGYLVSGEEQSDGLGFLSNLLRENQVKPGTCLQLGGGELVELEREEKRKGLKWYRAGEDQPMFGLAVLYGSNSLELPMDETVIVVNLEWHDDLRSKLLAWQEDADDEAEIRAGQAAVVLSGKHSLGDKPVNVMALDRANVLVVRPPAAR